MEEDLVEITKVWINLRVDVNSFTELMARKRGKVKFEREETQLIKTWTIYFDVRIHILV